MIHSDISREVCFSSKVLAFLFLKTTSVNTVLSFTFSAIFLSLLLAGKLGECPFASPISRSISHLEFFWVRGLSHLPFQMHKRYIRRIRTRGPMISRRTLSPLDYRTVAAEATENIWYLCTVGGPDPDPDPNPRGGGQLPNPKSAILR